MLVRISAGLALLFLAMQLVRPKLPSSPSVAELQAPKAVKQILEKSCYACHSNERKLSWFDEIAPAYWLVASDVKRARKHLNFSELGGQSPAKQRAALFQAVNFVKEGVMPLRSYARVHPDAVVTPAQLAILQDYLLPKEPVLRLESAVKAADGEYRKWMSDFDRPVRVMASPNGIAFPPEYKDWKIVDSTSRFDANTLRVILGNDIAIKAIADNNINPWPDGTRFAKVGWNQQPDESGAVQAGRFLKIGLMIKDRVKYAATAGWGWAEWEGTELKPYGDSSDFARECVTCHTPRRKSDYVFTMPIRFVRTSK